MYRLLDSPAPGMCVRVCVGLVCVCVCVCPRMCVPGTCRKQLSLILPVKLSINLETVLTVTNYGFPLFCTTLDPEHGTNSKCVHTLTIGTKSHTHVSVCVCVCWQLVGSKFYLAC